MPPKKVKNCFFPLKGRWFFKGKCSFKGIRRIEQKGAKPLIGIGVVGVINVLGQTTLPPRRYLSREEAAIWIGVSVDTFMALGIPYCDFGTLKAILNKAHREDRLATVPRFPKVKVGPGRCQWLTVDEERRLLGAAVPHLRQVLIFALDTGGRRSELFKLDWRYVDLERGRVTFIKTKNGEDRTLRLTNRAQAVLEAVGPTEQGPVFTYKGKAVMDMNTSFKRACEIACIEDFRFHDLRHTFASRLVQQGVPLYEIMHLTGHKTVSMVQRYAHLAPDFQERAIAKLNVYGHDFGTVEQATTAKKTSKSLKTMVGAAGIEPVRLQCKNQ